MAEDIIFKRRNRLKKHFTNTSNVLLYCYEMLTDAAKITFQVIDSFDLEDKESQDSKGYVFTAVETIAKLRIASDRTIRRHILELIGAKLLTRIRRRNKPSILYIEDVSDEEVNKYFDLLKAQAPSVPGQKEGSAGNSRTDKNDRSHKAQERTKMTVAYMNKNEREINKNNVNEDKTHDKKRISTGLMQLSDIMQQIEMKKHSPPKQMARSQTLEERVRRDYIAQHLAKSLDDHKSLGAFRVIATKVPEAVLLEYVATVKGTWQDEKVRKSGGALFMNRVQQNCTRHQIELGFQTQE